MRVELAHGGLSAAVETHGGELVSLRDSRGVEYIWGGDPAFWPGRNPLLFPIVGGLRGGTIRFDGRPCTMPRHGFARDNEFKLVEQGQTCAVLELRENEHTLRQYPYPFSLRVTHCLAENGFSTSFRVENTGDKSMPFCIGAHTAFRCPLREGERFEDYEVVFDRPEDIDLILLTPEGLLSHDRREPFLSGQGGCALDRADFARLDTIILEGLRSTGVSLRHRETGRGVRMEFAGFPMMALWTRADPPAPFLCLEPWHGCGALDNESGEFADKPHCVTLAPGERWELGYSVSLL